MSSATVIGAGFYQQLEMPWVDRLADQTTGGGLAWATGELPMLIVLIALLVQWSRADERTARRDDRRADRDGDRDLNAYNAMLKSLATTGRPAPAERPSTGDVGAQRRRGRRTRPPTWDDADADPGSQTPPDGVAYSRSTHRGTDAISRTAGSRPRPRASGTVEDSGPDRHPARSRSRSHPPSPSRTDRDPPEKPLESGRVQWESPRRTGPETAPQKRVWLSFENSTVC